MEKNISLGKDHNLCEATVSNGLNGFDLLERQWCMGKIWIPVVLVL